MLAPVRLATLPTVCILFVAIIFALPLKVCAEKYTDVCNNAKLFNNSPVDRSLKKEWQRDYPLLILDANHTDHLFWKEAHTADTVKMDKLANTVLLSKIYTTEKVLILICNAQSSDGWDVQQDTAVVVGTENSEPQSKAAGNAVDLVFVIDKATDNALTRVRFVKAPPTDSKAPPSVLAEALLERHRIIRFSAGGGLLLTAERALSYSASSVPTTLTTTTSTSSSTTTDGTQTGSTSTTTTANSTGTLTYAFKTPGSNPQFNALAGMTWYPFGRDTFPVTTKHRVGELFTSTYARRNALDYFGIYLGTSVNTLGNLTVAPALEVVPGVQVFAGPTWWNKTKLQSGVIACSGLGTSPSFQMAPSSSATTSTSTTTPGPPSSTTTTTTTTTISTSVISGCQNGNAATVISGTTPPTQSSFSRAWGFGVLLNTNLLKAFSGLTK